MAGAQDAAARVSGKSHLELSCPFAHGSRERTTLTDCASGTYADGGYGEDDNPGGEIMDSIESD